MVIAEGYKNANRPKIEVFRKEVHDAPLCLKDPNLLALITDARLEAGVPLFHPDQIRELADFIEKSLLHPPS
jgi:molybdopterin-guanine dinucleotide biosynthesis protein B